MNYATLTLKQLKEVAANKNIKPAGDKRKRQTWLDALTEAAIENIAEEMDSYFDADMQVVEASSAVIKEATLGGDRPIVLGNYVGHAQYKVLIEAAIVETTENNKLYDSLYKRVTELQLDDVSSNWRELRSDDEIVTVNDESADFWAGFNARRRELGL